MFQSTDLTEITDSNSAKLAYARWAMYPSRISYPDGSRAEFDYDDRSRLVKVKERNGLVWERKGEPGENRYALWNASDGQALQLRYEMLPSGATQRQERNGLTRTSLPSGKTFLSVAFSPNFDLEPAVVDLYHTCDTNRDQTLTVMELVRALNMPLSVPDFEKFVIIVLLSFEDILLERSDPMLIQSGGLERRELVAHDKRMQSAAHGLLNPTEHFNSTFRELFQLLDHDNDTMICFTDLPAIIGSPSFSAAQQTLIQMVIDYAFSLTSFEPFGFSDCSDWIYVEEFLKVCESAVRVNGKERLVEAGWWIAEATVKTVWSGPPVYGQAKTPVEAIRAQSIQTGPMGDRWFLAALAGLATVNPPAVPKMIVEKQIGTCTVTFPGAPAKALTMEMPGTVEAGLRIRSTKHGIWPAILEKAYSCLQDAQSNSDNMAPAISTQYDESAQHEFAQQPHEFSATSGITSSDASVQVTEERGKRPDPITDPVHVLTGRQGAWFDLASFTPDSLAAKLTENFRQRRIVICSTAETSQLLGNHNAFEFLTVVRLDREQNKVTLRSSHKTTDSTPDPEPITMDALKSRCKSIYLG